MKIAIFCMLFSALPSYGQQVPAPKRLRILTPAEIDPALILPSPPVDGSATQEQELADLKRLLAARTPERFTQAKWDQDHEDSSIFASVIGPAFDLKALPATAKMLSDIENDQNIAASAAKEYFHRVFAAVTDTSIVDLNCDPAAVRAGAAKPGGRVRRSYPSGHATLGFTVGIVLAGLIPEKAQAILARAQDYGYSREVCGEHYHSDVEASHALGTALGIRFLNSAALKPEFEAAKAELRAAHITTKQEQDK